MTFKIEEYWTNVQELSVVFRLKVSAQASRLQQDSLPEFPRIFSYKIINFWKSDLEGIASALKNEWQDFPCG